MMTHNSQTHLLDTTVYRPVIDLCIAATAIRHNLILATLNSKDFSGIPDLRTESWD